MNSDSSAGPPCRVLHLEDSPADAELVRERLLDSGYRIQVDWAANETEFVSFLQQSEYDLVLADYQLPGFDAQAALRLMKSFLPEIPFIVVTGAVGDEKAVELLKQGATDYVLKDRLERLPVSIERALDEAREHKARLAAEASLHRLNRQLRALSSCNQVLIRAESEQELLGDICRIICDEAGYRMAWVGYAQDDAERSVRPMAFMGMEDGYLADAGITWSDTEKGRGPTGTAIRHGKSVSVQDFTTDQSVRPWRNAARRRGYRSTIALPLKDEKAETFGALTIYSEELDAFTPEEIRLLEELAADLAFGIMTLRSRLEHKRMEEQIRALNEELEERVRSRTAELMNTNRDLEKMNKLFVGRELRMKELKSKIAQLEGK